MYELYEFPNTRLVRWIPSLTRYTTTRCINIVLQLFGVFWILTPRIWSLKSNCVLSLRPAWKADTICHLQVCLLHGLQNGLFIRSGDGSPESEDVPPPFLMIFIHRHCYRLGIWIPSWLWLGSSLGTFTLAFPDVSTVHCWRIYSFSSVRCVLLAMLRERRRQ